MDRIAANTAGFGPTYQELMTTANNINDNTNAIPTERIATA